MLYKQEVLVVLLQLLVDISGFFLGILDYSYFRKKLYYSVGKLCGGLSEKCQHKQQNNNRRIYHKADYNKEGKPYEAPNDSASPKK